MWGNFSKMRNLIHTILNNYLYPKQYEIAQQNHTLHGNLGRLLGWRDVVSFVINLEMYASMSALNLLKHTVTSRKHFYIHVQISMSHCHILRSGKYKIELKCSCQVKSKQ